ncbi:MAG: hypothetical protein ACLFVJ_09380 [Persicimonas sp.]
MRQLFAAGLVILLSALPSLAFSSSYDELQASLEQHRKQMVEQHDSSLEGGESAALEAKILSSIEKLFDAWMGTRWGMGAPQTQTPGEGKINCGMFVGTVLVHAGFQVNHQKLQRQPAELIIKSFAPQKTIRRFRNKSMETFIDGVREQGAGLYILGLDNHVGFLVVEKNDAVRFVHADYVSNEVVDEPAAAAAPIISSKYRVIGKILQPKMLEKWLEGDRFAVRGNW